MPNMKKILFLCLFLLSGFAHLAYSQDIAAHFKNYTTKDGLPANKVNCVLQAKNGFIWYGTDNGLAKFDGKHFTYYTNNVNKPNSVSSNIITALFEDEQKNIWIGTYEAGLNVFNIKTKKFTQFKQEDKENKLPDNRVMAIFKHPFKKDFVLVSLHFFGLVEIDLKTNKITPWEIKLPNGQKDLFGQNIINDVKFIPNQTNYLWITTNLGLLKYNYQTREGQFIYCNNKTPNQKYDILNNTFRTIELEGDSVVWLSSWGGGILKYLPKTKKWQQFLYDKSLPKSGGKNIVKNIITKSKTEFWVATQDNGFGSFDKKTGMYHFFEHQSEMDYSISEGKMSYNIYQDKDRGIWVMMNSGLGYLHPKNQISKRIYIPKPRLTTAKNLLGFTSALSIQNGNKILVTFEEGDGLYLFDAEYNYLQTIILPKQGNKSASLFNLTKGANPSVYFNSIEGNVYSIDENTLEIKELSVTLPNQNVQILSLSYIQNKLFIGLYTHGVAVFDGNSTSYINQDMGLISDLRIYKALEDVNHNIWFATDRGFSIYNPKTKKFKNYGPEQDISYKVISSINTDQNGDVWLASITGNIFVFSPKNNYQMIRKFIAGVNYPNQLNYSLNFSGNNTLWISNKTGFLRINVKDNNYSIYNQSNGVISNLNPQDYLIINQNQLLIPGIQYFDVLNVSRLEDVGLGKPKLTGIFLLNKEIEESDLSLLNYIQNNLTLQLSSFNYQNPENINYYYKLNKDNWQLANNATLNFANLKPDNYTLYYKSVNTLNQQESSMSSLKFKIKPPFWLTWWFALICGLIIMLVLTLAYQWRLKQIQKQNSLKVRYEKETANLKMTALRTQMNPHFLFNSLSAIKLLILKNESTSASQYLTKFSHLLRSILAYSQEETISLEQELNLSLNYIEIENLRLGDKMEFIFQKDEDIDFEAIKVPPLLLQPYLENAIWHGLMPLSKNGVLTLQLKKYPNYILICITDNGIGRTKSGEIAQSNPVKNKSFGVDITRKRIELFSDKYTHITEETVDVLNSLNQASGTQVILKINTSS
jgi:ligand-binding sensor domain-containing protein